MPRSAMSSGATGAMDWNCIAMVVRARKMIPITNQRCRRTDLVMSGASAGQHRHGRDLDHGAGAQPAVNDHAGGSRILPLEELAADVRRAAIVLGRRDVVDGLYEGRPASPAAPGAAQVCAKVLRAYRTACSFTCAASLPLRPARIHSVGETETRCRPGRA